VQDGVPIIDVYQLDGQKEVRIFGVDQYDILFDNEYATLSQIGKIDLGS